LNYTDCLVLLAEQGIIGSVVLLETIDNFCYLGNIPLTALSIWILFSH